MARQIFYKASVEKDLRKIGGKDSKRIIQKFEHAISTRSSSGEALKGEFVGLFKFRVGDYRVIYTDIKDGILVLRVSHRKQAYRY